MAGNFLFLEFTDEEIVYLLSSLRKIFTQKQIKTNIHITVRGPYAKTITEGEIKKADHTIKNDVILIAGVGRFSDSRHTVYLKVRSDNLEKIWDKPDYPKSKYGFNPHITMYDGNNAQLAEGIYKFLENEKLELLCHSFKLTPYVSKQISLFKENDSATKGHHFFELSNRRKVRADILERAHKLVKYFDNT